MGNSQRFVVHRPDLKVVLTNGSLVLQNLNIEIKPAERLAINGMSGSGKSTLLHLMAGLDKPDRGSIKINNLNLHDIKESELSSIRNKQFGFIYQFHHLLSDFTAIENIMMPLMIRGVSNFEKNTNAFNQREGS